MKCFVKELYYKRQCRKMWNKYNSYEGAFSFDEVINRPMLSVFGGMPIKEFAKRTSWRDVLGTFRRMYE